MLLAEILGCQLKIAEKIEEKKIKMSAEANIENCHLCYTELHHTVPYSTSSTVQYCTIL